MQDGTEKTLSEVVVKEAVAKGLDSPMRDSILEAVSESDSAGDGGSTLPLAGAMLGVGAAAGYLAGKELADSDSSLLEGVSQSELLEELTAEGDEVTDEHTVETDAVEMDVTEETDVPDADAADETESTSKLGILSRLLLAVGAIVGAVLLRRRLQSDEPEWEPVEEFEPATSADFMDDETDMAASEESAEEADEETVATNDEDKEE